MSAPESKTEKSNREAYERRRTWQNLWSRCDSTRWLDDRNADCLVWLTEKKHIRSRRPIRQFGQWLQSNLRENFNLVHDRLNKAGPARETMTAADILP